MNKPGDHSCNLNSSNKLSAKWKEGKYVMHKKGLFMYSPQN